MIPTLMNVTCKLCGQVGPLDKSHVIPDFFIRGLEYESVTGSQGKTQPFSILLSARPELKGGPKQRGHWEKTLGIKERLLCRVCERKFQKNEAYARTFLYGNTPPPLRKVAIGPTVDFSAQPDPSGLLGERKAVANYGRLKLFQMSILWRAGVAEGSFFREVNLGEFHEAKLRALLVAENPGLVTDYSCMMIDLQHNGKGCEDWIDQPRRTTDGHQCGYQFIIGGYLYLFTVSKQKPRPGLLSCCVRPSGELIVPIANAKAILRSRAVALRKLGRL